MDREKTFYMLMQNHTSKILIIDDESPIRSLLRDYFEKQNYKVFITGSGHTAIDLFKAEKPEVVITDIRMPDLDGIQVLQEIKRLEAETPVIVITAFPSLDNAIEALEEKAFDYIIKPFHLTEIKEKVEAALKSRNVKRDNLVLREMASLHKVTQMLASTQDLDKLLTLTMDQALRLSHADYGSIYLAEEGSGHLTLVKRNSQAGSLLLEREAEREISKNAYEHKQILHILDGKTNIPLNYTPASSLQSILSVPLLANKKAIGVLNLIREKEAISEKDSHVLHVLALQGGVAIHNAQLYTSLKRQFQDLTFINEYTEPLMEQKDKSEIMNSFFNALKRNFTQQIDFASFFFITKEGWELFYWTPYEGSTAFLENLQKEILQDLKTKCEVPPLQKKGKWMRHPLSDPTLDDRELNSLEFHFHTPLWVQERCSGSILVAAEKGKELSASTQNLISSLVSQTCIALVNAGLYDEMKENYLRTIQALAIAVDAKDSSTGGHSGLVSQYAGMIAKAMKMDENEVSNLVNAGLLHDVGKIGIPGHILNKPGLLTSDEFNNVMTTHSAMGANIIREVPFLQELYLPILHHHERYDGEGYPEGIKGEKIPLGARILAVADAYAAMTHDRPYRKELSLQEACRQLQEGRGSQFDPHIVDIFLELIQEKKIN